MGSNTNYNLRVRVALGRIGQSFRIALIGMLQVTVLMVEDVDGQLSIFCLILVKRSPLFSHEEIEIGEINDSSEKQTEKHDRIAG